MCDKRTNTRLFLFLLVFCFTLDQIDRVTLSLRVDNGQQWLVVLFCKICSEYFLFIRVVISPCHSFTLALVESVCSGGICKSYGDEKSGQTYEKLKSDIRRKLAGKAAVELQFGVVDMGAESDIESATYLARDAIEGFMYSVLPLKVRLPSGAMAIVPPAAAIRIQVLIAVISNVCFFMGIGATKYLISEESQPIENRSSEAK